MIESLATTHTTIQLTLDEEAAEWLKRAMQNAFYADESMLDSKMRQHIFMALDSPIRHPKAGGV